VGDGREDPNIFQPNALDTDQWDYNTVGRNCQLLLNFPPDTNGVFDQKSLDMMSGMGQEIRATFATDLAAGTKPWPH
jgi:alpha-L-fucosidase